MRTGSHRLFIALVLALLAIAPQAARANTDASPAPSAAASAPATGDPAIMAQAKEWLARLQSGHVDKAARSLALLRSQRDPDRERALREGGLPLARLAGRTARALRRR